MKNAAELFVSVEIQRGQFDFAKETDLMRNGVPDGWVSVPESILQEWTTLNQDMKEYLKSQLIEKQASSKASKSATVAASTEIAKNARKTGEDVVLAPAG